MLSLSFASRVLRKKILVYIRKKIKPIIYVLWNVLSFSGVIMSMLEFMLVRFAFISCYLCMSLHNLFL